MNRLLSDIVYVKTLNEEYLFWYSLKVCHIKVYEDLTKIFCDRCITCLHVRGVNRINNDAVWGQECFDFFTEIFGRPTLETLVVVDYDLKVLTKVLHAPHKSHSRWHVVKQRILRWAGGCPKGLFLEVCHYALEADNENRMIHHWHSPCKVLSPRPFVLLWCRR